MLYFSNNFLNKNLSGVIKAVYAFAVTWCLPEIFGWAEGIAFSYSVFSVILFGVIWWSLSRFWDELSDSTFGNKVLYCLLSFAFLTSMVLGNALDTKGYIELSNIRGVLTPIVVMPYAAMLLCRLYSALEEWLEMIRYQGNSSCEYLDIREAAVYFVFLVICWGIVLLAVYPGFFVYDAQDELMQIITRQFNTHHPLLHALYMGGIVQAGYKLFGSYNAGIFLFTVVQMLIAMSAVIYVAAKMHRFGFSTLFVRGVIAFFGLFPVFPMFILCSSKDSIFAIVVLLWLVETYEWIRFDDHKFNVKWLCLSVIMCLLRKNAIYALLLTGVFFVAFAVKKRMKAALLFMAAAILTFFCTSALEFATGASSSEHQEMLTVPIQQIARVYNLEPQVFTQEEREQINRYLPDEYLRRYVPKLSDGVKIGFDNQAYEEDMGGFWEIWIKGLKSSPVSYLNAWLLTCYGYMYPDTVIDVYRGSTVFTFTYEDNAYFGYETEQPGERQSLIPAIDNFYRKLSLSIYKEKLPVVSMLFSPGMVLWLYVFGVGFLLKRNIMQGALVYVFPLAVVATLLLGPTFLPRYVFYLWLCIPVLIGDIVYGTDI